MNILKENEKSYDELVEMNRMLEKRLAEEIVKNRQKDLFFVQQARLTVLGETLIYTGYQWRQQLNGLTLLIQDLRDALEFGEITDHYIDGFTRESMIHIQQITSTFNDYRKFFRINKKKSNFFVSDAIEDALSIFNPCLRRHDIDIEFVHCGQHLALGFPYDYSLAVLIILLNARDSFVKCDQHNRIIQIQIHEETHNWVAHFTDNAGLIAPTSLSCVFEPYDTTKNHGSGFGHYLTKIIIENMNGSVKVENTVDGTRFTLFVPKAAPGNIRTEF
jgi:C4-dicarboxylate-specific signal transduction histidine kinase